MQVSRFFEGSNEAASLPGVLHQLGIQLDPLLVRRLAAIGRLACDWGAGALVWM